MLYPLAKKLDILACIVEPSQENQDFVVRIQESETDLRPLQSSNMETTERPDNDYTGETHVIFLAYN